MPQIIKTEKNSASTQGIMFPGKPNTFLGNSLRGAGDVNGDGIPDMILGASIAANFTGSAFVVFGGTNLPSMIDVFSLNGENGFKISGVKRNAQLGFSVSSAGDINGDGLSDILLGAPYGARFVPGFSGSAYVIYGANSTFPAELDVSTLNGQNGFEIKNDNTQIHGMGYSVSGIGDFNADGVDDIAVGAPKYSDFSPVESAVFVVFGQKNGFPAQFKVSELNGSNGFLVHTAINDTTLFGGSVSGAKDINGDGVPDLMIGAPYFYGTVYVVYGHKGSFPPSWDINELNGQNGFNLTTFQTSNSNGLGMSVSAGDINGDGLSDMIMGAPYDNSNVVYEFGATGATYIVFGNNQLPASFNISMLNGQNGFCVNGVASSGGLGQTVDFAGDVNGDGLGDVLIGMETRYAYVVYGQTGGFPASFNVTDIDGENGFEIVNSEENETVVGGAGDINGDGVDDVFIGSPGYNQAGAFNIFGRSSDLPAFPANVTLPPMPNNTLISSTQPLSTLPRNRKLWSLAEPSKISMEQKEAVKIEFGSGITAGITRGALGLFSSLMLLSGTANDEQATDGFNQQPPRFDLNIPAALIAGSFVLAILSLLFYVLFQQKKSSSVLGSGWTGIAPGQTKEEQLEEIIPTSNDDTQFFLRRNSI